MSIPDEAVYAAAEAVYGSGFDGSPSKEAWLADFRIALEAAAPYMLPKKSVTVRLAHIEGALPFACVDPEDA